MHDRNWWRAVVNQDSGWQPKKMKGSMVMDSDDQKLQDASYSKTLFLMEDTVYFSNALL